MDSEAPPSHIDSFITRWAISGGAERANYQIFLAELCDVLEVPRPDPTVGDAITSENWQNAYVFEQAVRFDNRDGTHSTPHAVPLHDVRRETRNSLRNQDMHCSLCRFSVPR